MATETSIEAARSRIQQLVDEIAALSKAELSSEDFFRQYIARVVGATDAHGGAVWLVGSAKGEFQLCAETNFESSRFQSDETQRANILKILGEVVSSGHPAVLAPENPAAIDPAANLNCTPFPFLHVPLFLKGKPLGVLQVWLKPYIAPQNYAEFVTFLITLAGYVEQHLQSRQLGKLVLETQRLQHLLRFASDLAGTLDAQEVARLTANYARDILGCERCSVLLREGDRWFVTAISGQETVEKKSALVKGMVAFVAAHSREEMRTVSKKELLASAEAPLSSEPATELSLEVKRTDAIDLAYFDLSHVVSAALAPLTGVTKQFVGILFCESTIENFFAAPVPGRQELPPPQSLAQWLAVHAGRGIDAARDYQTLPLLHPMRRVREVQRALTGEKRNRFLARLAVIAAVVLVAALWPVQWKVDGNCVVIPLHRAQIVSEVPARIGRVLVREGDFVKKGQPVAELDTRRLLTELEITTQEKLRFLAESDRYRAAGDQGSAQIALLQSHISGQNEARLRADIASATLRAPFDGTILTKDVESRAGEFLQTGAALAEIADIHDWELQVEIAEKNIGMVETALRDRGSINANFILYTQSAQLLHTKLTSHRQISAAAYPKEKESVFILTFPNPEIPDGMRKNLRPGLTGRAKLELGRHPLIAVTTRRIIRWFQMRFIG